VASRLAAGPAAIVRAAEAGYRISVDSRPPQRGPPASSPCKPRKIGRRTPRPAPRCLLFATITVHETSFSQEPLMPAQDSAVPAASVAAPSSTLLCLGKSGHCPRSHSPPHRRSAHRPCAPPHSDLSFTAKSNSEGAFSIPLSLPASIPSRFPATALPLGADHRRQLQQLRKSCTFLFRSRRSARRRRPGSARFRQSGLGDRPPP